ISTARPQVFHRAHSAARPEWQRGPSGAVSALDNARKAGEDRRVRGAAACLPVPLLAGVLSAQAQTAVSPLFRLFLTDGTEVVTYGEFTRLDDQVVAAVPVGALDAAQPELQTVTLAADRVNWPRTEAYLQAVRLAQYTASTAERDYAAFV